jgi:hypothetical protein
MESVSASAATIRSLPQGLTEIANQNTSQPSSPRSSALPSPPDSPSDSVSSLPSVSSSFFFSSAAASPPHSHPQPDSTQGLIIPSLTLPSAVPRSTPYGQNLGEIRLLVLGSQGSGRSFLSGILVEDNEDVVEVGTWEATEHGALLRASTDWVEHRDAYGLDKTEPSRNIEILEVPGYEHSDDVSPPLHSCTIPWVGMAVCGCIAMLFLVPPYTRRPRIISQHGFDGYACLGDIVHTAITPDYAECCFF